jgi:hypothetical protein
VISTDLEQETGVSGRIFIENGQFKDCGRPWIMSPEWGTKPESKNVDHSFLLPSSNPDMT